MKQSVREKIAADVLAAEDPEELEAVLRKALTRVRGLMTVPPEVIGRWPGSTVAAEAARKWITYRRDERLRPWKTVTWEAKVLAFPSAEAFAAAVDQSVANGWQGLFPARDGTKLNTLPTTGSDVADFMLFVKSGLGHTRTEYEQAKRSGCWPQGG